MRADELVLFGSFFAGHRDVRPQPFEMQWNDFVAAFMDADSFATREDKFADSWGYSLARFVPRGDAEAKRGNAHVDVLSGISLDFDKNYDLAQVFARLQGLVYLAYTTFSHTPENPRWRVIVPTSEPISGPRFPAVRAWLVTCLNGGMPPSTKYGADEQAKAVSNFYFGPGCPAASRGDFAWTDSSDNPNAVVLVPPPLEELRKGIPTTRIVGSNVDWVFLEARMIAYAKDADLRRAFKLVLKGRSFAQLGERDTLLTRMCGVLAGWAPSCEPAQLAEKFAASLDAMSQENPEDPPPTLEQAIDKIARAQASMHALAKDSGEFVVATAQTVNVVEPAPADAFEQAAHNVGLTGDELRSRLLLRVDNSLWVWMQKSETWEGPVNDKAAVWFAQAELPQVPGVQVFVRKKDGGIRYKTLDELAVDHGEVARKVIASLHVTEPSYDKETRELTLVGAERRRLEPQEDKQVAEWLYLLGGNDEILLDWISGITKHDVPNSILFIRGAPSIGKTLLARGLSRVWNVDGPTDMRVVMNNFNDELRRCPLVTVEEGKWSRFDDMTTKLRKFATEASRTINKKFHQTMELSGHLRLMVTANNFNIFAGDQHALSPDDRDAIAERFLEITPAPETAAYLDAIPRKERDELASADRIARHALWLVQTRNVTPGPRFYVPGKKTGQLADRMTTGDGNYGSWVTEWLVKYLSDPVQIEIEQSKRIYRGEGMLIIGTEAVVDTFEKVLRNRKPPQSGEISKALAALALPGVRDFPDGKGRGFEIIVDKLVQWSNENCVGNADQIRANVRAPRIVRQVNTYHPRPTQSTPGILK